jgi:choline monooxygenase
MSTTARRGRGATLPWDWYVSPDVLRREQERVFRGAWHYAGPLEWAAHPGDRFPCRAGEAPIVVVRDREEQLRAFLNVCPHRGSVIVKERGRRETLQCPYHAWTYALDGSLRSAPRSEREESFEADELGLRPALVDTWGPLVFVNADLDAPSLADALGPLPGLIDAAGLVFRERCELELAANWKVAVENYLECYHCPVAHPGFSSVIDVTPDAYELAATAHRLSHRAPLRREPASPAYAAAGSVTAGSYHLLLPNVKININPGRQNLSIGPVYPDGVGRTTGFLDYYFGADADEAWVEDMMAFDTDVGNEDAALVAAVQPGVASGMIDRGRLLPQERLIASFQRYVHAACAGEVPADLGS